MCPHNEYEQKRRCVLSELALLGGRPVRDKLFPPINTLVKRKRRRFFSSTGNGRTFRYVASHSADFMGGPRVREFEHIGLRASAQNMHWR